MSQADVEGEVLSEEDAPAGEAPERPVRALPQRFEESSTVPVLRTEVRTAAIAVAGGALAGAATVAAARAVGAVGSRKRGARQLSRRSSRPSKVVASRSFLVDVHLLGR